MAFLWRRRHELLPPRTSAIRAKRSLRREEQQFGPSVSWVRCARRSSIGSFQRLRRCDADQELPSLASDGEAVEATTPVLSGSMRTRNAFS